MQEARTETLDGLWPEAAGYIQDSDQLNQFKKSLCLSLKDRLADQQRGFGDASRHTNRMSVFHFLRICLHSVDSRIIHIM